MNPLRPLIEAWIKPRYLQTPADSILRDLGIVLVIFTVIGLFVLFVWIVDRLDKAERARNERKKHRQAQAKKPVPFAVNADGTPAPSYRDSPPVSRETQAQTPPPLPRPIPEHNGVYADFVKKAGPELLDILIDRGKIASFNVDMYRGQGRLGCPVCGAEHRIDLHTTNSDEWYAEAGAFATLHAHEDEGKPTYAG